MLGPVLSELTISIAASVWLAPPSERVARLGDVQMTVITRFLKDESGATAIEYGLLAALISVVIIGSVKVLGTKVNGAFNSIANNLS
jgi:pilus assembly protein Flp/PilA